MKDKYAQTEMQKQAARVHLGAQVPSPSTFVVRIYNCSVQKYIYLHIYVYI